MKKSKGVLPAVGKILLVLLGNTLYALAIALFVLPSGLITGGTTGLGLVAQHQSTAQLATRWLSLPSSQGIIEEKGMPSPCSYRYDFPGRQSTWSCALQGRGAVLPDPGHETKRWEGNADEAEKALSLLLALLIAAGIPMGSLAAWEDPFTDVRAGDWFYGAVKYVNTAGLFHGTAPHAFSPETPMTRGMFVTVLGKASNVDTAGYDSSQFADVPSGAYYAPYAAWAAEAGVVSGTSPTAFSPEEPILREDMATMLYKYAMAYGHDGAYDETSLQPFPDAGKISGYAQVPMAWAVTHGVLAGSDGYLDPQGETTRAQAAQIFLNARDVLSFPEGETPPAEEPPEQCLPPLVDPTPDAPWLEGQREELEGGTRTLSALGVTRAALLKELEAHEHDDYYLGTPYIPGDYQSPNGDTTYNGRPGMNCGGFVSYVLRKAGLQAEEAMRLIKLVPDRSFLFGSGKPYDLLAGASNYRNLIKNAGLEAYVFSSPLKLISSGKAEKGDILFIDKGPSAKPGDDTHIGFYWEHSISRAMWHSGDHGNTIGMVAEATSDPVYILIKIE